MPVELVTPDRDRIVLDPLERDDDRARAQTAERRRAVDRVGDDRVVDVDVRDREVVALRVPDEDPDLARRELDTPDVELVRRRRIRADEVDERRAARSRPAPTTSASSSTGTTAHSRQLTPAAIGVAERLHHPSTTSKKPIQPSSANSDWCAWNMCSPVPANWISSTPRWPWHCITVSVYSQLSPVPVGW